jgi:hypothetical protein
MLENKMIVFFLVIVSLNACKPKVLSPKDYVHFAKSEKSNLLKVRELGDFKFEVFHQTVDYKLALEYQNNNNKTIAERTKEIEGMDYFTLKITPLKGNESILKYNLQSEEDYQARLAYFSFDMQNDIFLEKSGKKVPCSLYHFERAYDLTNYRVFDLAFETNNNTASADKILILHSDFFETGPIKFIFKAKDLQQLPKVNWDKK